MRVVDHDEADEDMIESVEIGKPGCGGLRGPLSVLRKIPMAIWRLIQSWKWDKAPLHILRGGEYQVKIHIMNEELQQLNEITLRPFDGETHHKLLMEDGDMNFIFRSEPFRRYIPIMESSVPTAKPEDVLTVVTDESVVVDVQRKPPAFGLSEGVPLQWCRMDIIPTSLWHEMRGWNCDALCINVGVLETRPFQDAERESHWVVMCLVGFGTQRYLMKRFVTIRDVNKLLFKNTREPLSLSPLGADCRARTIVHATSISS
jgi:hypothetical protein